MTYAIGGLIQANDFNLLVGSSTTPISGTKLNAIYGAGYGRWGYGQIPVPNVTTGNIVYTDDWANLVTAVNKISSHTGSGSSITVPQDNDKIAYISTLTGKLTTNYTSSLNAVSQGSTATTNTTTTSSWSRTCVFTHNIIFESGSKARYFFNAGGQIALSFSHPTGTGINALFKNLATACGTIILSSPIGSDTAKIAGITYNGVTKIGGSGTYTLKSGNGYYDLTTSNSEIFRQTSVGTPTSAYFNSYISVSVKSNGPQTAYGDAGSMITVTTTWNEIPAGGLTVANGSQVFVTVRNPSTTHLTKTWGNVSVVGTYIAQ